MKCILLAAGYATRLYPLTQHRPKSLLDVAGKPILEHILLKIEEVSEIDEVILVSNGKFYEPFREWAGRYTGNKKIVVLNDGTFDNEHRLGAVADIQYAIEHEQIRDDILVMAGDNLFDFSLFDFVAYYHRVQADCITVHELSDRTALQRTGVVTVNEENVVIHFEEKPREPQSNLAVPPFYIYRKETLPFFQQYLTEGHNPDAPGYFIPYLLTKKAVHAYSFIGKRYDVGTMESYLEVQKVYGQQQL